MPAVLIANRGEVAVRVARAAGALGLRSIAVHAEDDAGSLHVRVADEAVPLTGTGPAAYLDAERLVAAATAAGATLVHPGWGFLSEDASFAARCGDAGLGFAGPGPEVLRLLGDKPAARAVAAELGVPVLPGTGTVTLDEARTFLRELGGPAMVKAVAGGGGRGIRPVRDVAGLDRAWERCAAEAQLATGSPAVYLEELRTGARHVEVQVAGDGTDAVALGTRDCSLQRRHQKVVEITPAPALDADVEKALVEDAVRIARHLRYRGLGTVEFLVGPDGDRCFLEANPRLQVEHPVTEAVWGVDLVQAQLRLAAGAALGDTGLTAARPSGWAVEVRLNAGRPGPGGVLLPAAGVMHRWRPPAGPGVRVDSGVAEGDPVPAGYDPLLAKIVVHAAGYGAALAGARQALADLVAEGVDVDVATPAAVLADPRVAAGALRTDLLDEIVAGAGGGAPAGPADPGGGPAVTVDSAMTGMVVEIAAAPGSAVAAGAPVVVLEAMKMHHEVHTPVAGIVREVRVATGGQVSPGEALFTVEPADVDDTLAGRPAAEDPDTIRPDLARVLDRRRGILDEARPDAVRRRHDRGRRTARENVEDLCEPGSFEEYGGLALAAQKARRSEEELIATTPADGLVMGIGDVDGGTGATRCAVLAYDYTVLAGTQGVRNHTKTDRLLEIAHRQRLPVVLFAEGGGGRPGDTDQENLFQLVVPTFGAFARLSGLVPRIGVVSGRCFAGNASLLGCCDVVIATPDASIGMGGPAMIEGGGLGRFAPEEVGPVDVLARNGVIDVVAGDEAEAVRLAQRLVGYLTDARTDATTGPHDGWECADQRVLRTLVPADPKRTHDPRAVLEALADTGSVLELRRGFGRGVVTAFARLEGRAVGVLANDPSHLGGAVDAEASDKAARFVQLCDAFGLPVVSLVDTPGFMVGPEAEATGLVRRSSRLFTVAATMTAPWLAVVLRRAYGLGAMAMTGGSFRAPLLTLSWPTGEFGAMGVEGAVRLGLRKELEAVPDPEERERRVQEIVAQVRAHSGALTMAAHFEIDDVIDPADTRARLVAALRSAPPEPLPPSGRRRTMIDTW